MGEHFDLLIRGGVVYDGSGDPGRPGDVGVRGGRIAALGGPGELGTDAARRLEVDGLAVCPGFVDIHTHYDAQVLWDRSVSISPWHGVTTAVMGNCGFGIAPTRPEHRDLILRTLENVEGMSLDALHAGLGSDWPFESFPDYLDAVEERGSAINLAALLGHTPLRTFVLGEEATERAATDREIATMAALARESFAAGAAGFATSKSPTHVGAAGRPVPSRAAHFDEVARIVDELSHGVIQATIGRGLFIDELTELQQRTGRTVSWTALLTTGRGPDFHRGMLARHAELQARGVEVVPQVSCRPLNFEFQFEAPFIYESMACFEPVSAADREGKKRIFADPEFRQAFREGLSTGVLAGGWDRTVVAQYDPEPELAEREVAALARERGVDPVDLVLDLALASDLEARFRAGVMNTDEEGVAELLTHPCVVLGLSDAGAHASQLCDACFSTHLLGYWVRERGTLELPQAIRMLTSRAAEVFGIEGRGRLAEGAAADVVVFDPERVGCTPLRRVHDLPGGADRLISEARGIEAVIVNGQMLRESGKDVLDSQGPLPGRLLRSGRRA
ncbi:MAG: N-acyl-D-amino-acid deacylase family protein [Myxococcota bacterium]